VLSSSDYHVFRERDKAGRFASGGTKFSAIDRFMDKVDVLEGFECLIWNGARSNLGYGAFNNGERTVPAHRFIYEHCVGPLGGSHIDHICRNPRCVNPLHFRAVTNYDNWNAGFSPTKLRKLQTHCKRGHEFTQDNTYENKSGGRRCRRCHADSEIKRYYSGDKRKRRKEANS
jgi:hypothetical protein